MSKGKLNLQAADGAVIGLVVPDGLTSGERQITLGANLSGITAYHLLQGNLAVSNSTITQGFNTTLYTSASATTGIDMDTQWGNTVEEKFGGLVWLKDRAEATNNFLYDTIRGATKEINSNTTEAEATLAGGLTAFNSTGFTVGADVGHNSTTNNMASWNFQTTHRVSGTTNHGKAYTCHYNPFTGFTIVKYEGSGIAGHEIPHHLGRKLGFWNIKDITSASNNWATGYREGNQLKINLVDAESILTTGVVALLDNVTVLGNSIAYNTTSNQHIMYGWANSYFDESNKLIGNYELVPYQGTGAAGNKVKTKGKPAWVMIKSVTGATGWSIFDNVRDTDGIFDSIIRANTSTAEAINSAYDITQNEDGFTVQTTDAEWNASGGQYIALVAYDTNSNGGGSYYPLASDTANVQINNALIPLAQGIDSNGAKNTILSKNETITGLTYTQGKNYVYCDKNGSYGVRNIAPVYTDTFSTETIGGVLKGDEFHITQNKWQTIANTPRGDLANPSLVNVFGDGSCKALYRFEGNANDESGTYNGTATNITYTTGVIGQCAVFNGTSSYMNLSANPFPFSVKTLSVSNWIYGSINSVVLGFGRKSGNVAYNGSYWFRIIGGCMASGLSQSYDNSSYNATAGRIGWNHYVTTLASNIVSIYCNGVLEKSWTLSANEQAALNAYTNLYGLNEETVQYSSVQIDQVRLFNKALSETEVKSLYNLYNYTYDQTNSRNYLNHIVYADTDGGVLYVEELPKVEYKDVVKANEFKGKNACTAWVNFDGTTTPPTIRDSYNVSAVIRVATGWYDIYFKEAMDNVNYSIETSQSDQFMKPTYNLKTLNKCTVETFYITNTAGAQTRINGYECNVHIDGGKN